MVSFRTQVPSLREPLPSGMLCVFLAMLAIAGGASRADAWGQVVVRGGSVLIVCVLIAFGAKVYAPRYRAIALLLAAIALLAIIQLIPLPPAIWSILPGRGAFLDVMPEAGLTQPWRPLNLVPDAGLNALFSLLPAAAMLAICVSLGDRGRAWLLPSVILLALGSALFALLQAAGAAPDNIFVNGSAGDYSGFFANRNHQALLLAIGIAAILFWGFERGFDWRAQRCWLAIAGAGLLGLSIIVTGSRTGLALAVLATVGGILTSQRWERRRAIHWRRIAILGLVGAALAGAMVGASLLAGRASSLDRLALLNPENDLRLRVWPAVWHLIMTYFPFGAGFGSFDPVFRAAEPLDLLKPTYLNHAHNDFLELLVETGLAGLALLVAALVWAARATAKAFSSRGRRSARLGAVIVALVVVASVFDYPARTPLVMAVLVIAGCWMAAGVRVNGRPPVELYGG